MNAGYATNTQSVLTGRLVVLHLGLFAAFCSYRPFRVTMQTLSTTKSAYNGKEASWRWQCDILLGNHLPKQCDRPSTPLHASGVP